MVYLSRMGMGGISYLTTSILRLLEIMPHCGIFVMIGEGGRGYPTTSILPLCEIMPRYGIFVMIGDGGYKLLDHLYSVLSRNYAPLWYVCHDWG